MSNAAVRYNAVMRQKGMARTIGLALVALVIVGFGLFIATRPPVPWPAEARRVVHPAGFSIVGPPDWDHFLSFATDGKPDAVRFLPKKTVSGMGSILVTKVAVPVTPDELARKKYGTLTFQNQPAYTNTDENRFTRDHSRSFLFQRDGVWYDLSITRPQVEPIETGVWLAYAESFRVEPVRVQPTTRPTTGLSVTP